MRIFRLVASILILVFSVVVIAKVRAQAQAPLAQVPCGVTSLGAAFTSGEALQSVSQYGCEGEWAYMWATIGTGPGEVGVTEVLHYDALSGAWRLAQRQYVCKPTILPSVIYRQGCFSN